MSREAFCYGKRSEQARKGLAWREMSEAHRRRLQGNGGSRQVVIRDFN
jgi:hypothetical protein